MSDFEASLLLGKATPYKAEYDSQLLCPFPRKVKRDEIGIGSNLPFSGYDIWNAFELSWLNSKGKPIVAIGEFHFPCESPNLIESKSFKLYLNSYNQTHFDDFSQVQQRLVTDLSAVSGVEVAVKLRNRSDFSRESLYELPGQCIDDLDIDVDDYSFNADFLINSSDPDRLVEEELNSHLLKSNCLVTNQPDWGSVLIRYRGGKINPEALLRYIISFRQHNEFHEQCVERIFVDLLNYCHPEKLTVYARYTRRGGLDINPFRSNFESQIANFRLARQ